MCDWIPHKDLILEAIDQLRRRKARPDAERIYNCLFRRKGLGSNESRIALDRCVENGIVLRVSYKGNISYRNAAKKLARQKRRLPLADLGGAEGAALGGRKLDNKPRRKFTNLLTNTFTELVLQEPDYLEDGIPPEHLIKTILDKDHVRYTKKYLWILLQKEVEHGGLVRLENGNFQVGKPASICSRKQQHHPEKEQLSRIKREIRHHPVMHRKPVFDAKKGDIKAADLNRASDVRAHAEKAVKREGGDEDRGGDDDDDEDDADDNGDDDENSRASSSDTSVKMPTATAAARRGGGRPSTRGRYLRRGRPPLKRDRLATNMKHTHNENSLRVGGRRKKAKKVFDPSESNMPKRRGRPLGSTKSNGYKRVNNLDSGYRPESRASPNERPEGGVCSVCHAQSKKVPGDKMISCRECSNKAHSSCLNGDDMMLKMYPDNTWQCPHCKTCVVCYETSDAGNLVVCSICADAYHNVCHSPRVTEKMKSTTKWLCNNCKMADQLAVDNIQIGYSMEPKKEAMESASNEKIPESIARSPDLSQNSSPRYDSPPCSPTLPTLSPQMNHNGHGRHSSPDLESDSHSVKDEDIDDENVDPSIPDATNWSPDEVTRYFAEYFPDEARVFKDQEIDGHSLLLMQRKDVIKGLHLKLGPALKIYRHVLKLQYRRDDRKLYWI